MALTTHYLVCPQCLARNRVPQERLRDQPVCGQCQSSLVSTHPLELNDGNFDRFVTRTDLPVVVDFWATWCPPCRMMAPAFSKAAEQLAPEFILAKVDTEAAPVTAGRYRIQGIPCLIAFQGGQEIARQSGAMPIDDILRWVRSIPLS